MKNSFLQRKLIWIVLIFFLASIFRIFNLDLIEFKFDEAYTVFQMEQFYAHPYLMQVGPPQSTGVYNPPLYNYILIFFSLFSRDPQYLSFVIALINTIFIMLFYLVIRRFYGNLTAVFSSLLIALSPWSIIFSRKIWIPDLILPFMVGFLFFLHRFLFDKKSGSLVPTFIMLGLLVQMHASGWFFAFVTILIFFALKVSISWKKVIVGFLIGFIPAIPYFLRQLSSTPICIDCASFLNYQALPKPFDFNVFVRPFQLLGGMNFEALLGNDYLALTQSSPILGLINYTLLLQLLILPFGLIYIIKRKRQYLFLLFYPVAVPILYFLTKTPSYMHYFTILIPVMALIFGYSLSILWNLSKVNFGKAAVGVIFLVFLATNFIFISKFFDFISVKQIIDGDFGSIYPKTRDYVVDQVKDYRMLPDYGLIKAYAFMFAKPEIIHGKLGELFLSGGSPDLAVNEFKKAIDSNSKDSFSRANLSYIYLLSGKDESALEELNTLKSYDATSAAKLEVIFENIKAERLKIK